MVSENFMCVEALNILEQVLINYFKPLVGPSKRGYLKGRLIRILVRLLLLLHFKFSYFQLCFVVKIESWMKVRTFQTIRLWKILFLCFFLPSHVIKKTFYYFFFFQLQSFSLFSNQDRFFKLYFPLFIHAKRQERASCAVKRVLCRRYFEFTGLFLIIPHEEISRALRFIISLILGKLVMRQHKWNHLNVCLAVLVQVWEIVHYRSRCSDPNNYY